MFIFKKKKIVVDCFTYKKGILECSKPERAINYAPDWWKTCPTEIKRKKDIYPTGTIKTCPAFVGLYSTGFVIPMWCDLAIEMGPEGEERFKWQYSDEESKLDYHSFDQINDYLDPKKYSQLKLITPWKVKTKNDLNWIWMQPEWNHLKNYDYRVVPGLRNFKNLHGCYINMFVKRSVEVKDILIKYQTPLVHLVPLCENADIKLKYHLVTEEEWENMSMYPTTFKKPTSKYLKCIASNYK